MDKKIGKLIKVVKALTQLALEVGTLIAVIKMVIESIKPPLPKNIIVCLQNQYDKEYFKTCGGGCLADYRGCGLVSAVYVNHTAHLGGHREKEGKI